MQWGGFQLSSAAHSIESHTNSTVQVQPGVHSRYILCIPLRLDYALYSRRTGSNIRCMSYRDLPANNDNWRSARFSRLSGNRLPEWNCEGFLRVPPDTTVGFCSWSAEMGGRELFCLCSVSLFSHADHKRLMVEANKGFSSIYSSNFFFKLPCLFILLISSVFCKHLQ